MIISRQRVKMAVTLNPMILLSMRYYTFMHCEIYSFLFIDSIHTHTCISLYIYSYFIMLFSC